MPVTDAELDANLDEDTADRHGEIADQIAKENP